MGISLLSIFSSVVSLHLHFYVVQYLLFSMHSWNRYTLLNIIIEPTFLRVDFRANSDLCAPTTLLFAARYDRARKWGSRDRSSARARATKIPLFSKNPCSFPLRIFPPFLLLFLPLPTFFNPPRRSHPLLSPQLASTNERRSFAASQANMFFALNKVTILFGVTNLVRLFSVIAICLVLAGQIITMVKYASFQSFFCSSSSAILMRYALQ